MHDLISAPQFGCSAEISFISGTNTDNHEQLRSPNDLVNDGEDPCMVCLERPPDAILLECGHSGLCVECATVLWDQASPCPLCRRSFAAIMRIVALDAHSVRALRLRKPRPPTKNAVRCALCLRKRGPHPSQTRIGINEPS
jgi:hypothetical protein